MNNSFRIIEIIKLRYLSTKIDWLNNWHEEMRRASLDSILLTGEAPHIIIMTALKDPK